MRKNSNESGLYLDFLSRQIGEVIHTNQSIIIVTLKLMKDY